MIEYIIVMAQTKRELLFYLVNVPYELRQGS